jgi:DNA (cytosine-5)-methyltransferase 1
MIEKKFTVISTFAGCGGSSLGYKMAGFKELLAIDLEAHPCEMLRANFKDLTVWQKDINKVTSESILEEIGLKRGELDILDGSPPCQGFSTANTKRNPQDQKNSLIYEQIRLIKGLNPKVFVIENVPGMVGDKMKKNWEAIKLQLFSLGYFVKVKIINAMNYGVAQNRKRVIIIGVRKDLKIKPSFPKWSNDNIKTFTEITGYEGFVSTDFFPKVFSGNKPVCTITKTPNIHFIQNDKEFEAPIDDIKALCSFPKSFILKGSYNKQYNRLGNSVMPLMMKAIAENIKINILEPANFLSLTEDSESAIV